MPTEKETAFVLPVEAAASMEPQTIPGLPGLWTPGEPKTVTELGLTATEARDLVKEHGAPLEATKATPPADGWLDKTGGMLSGATAESTTALVSERSASEFPGLSEDEAEARRAEKAAADKAAAAASAEGPAKVEPEPAPEPGGES